MLSSHADLISRSHGVYFALPHMGTCIRFSSIPAADLRTPSAGGFIERVRLNNTLLALTGKMNWFRGVFLQNNNHQAVYKIK